MRERVALSEGERERERERGREGRGTGGMEGNWASQVWNEGNAYQSI